MVFLGIFSLVGLMLVSRLWDCSLWKSLAAFARAVGRVKVSLSFTWGGLFVALDVVSGFGLAVPCIWGLVWVCLSSARDMGLDRLVSLPVGICWFLYRADFPFYWGGVVRFSSFLGALASCILGFVGIALLVINS